MPGTNPFIDLVNSRDVPVRALARATGIEHSRLRRILGAVDDFYVARRGTLIHMRRSHLAVALVPLALTLTACGGSPQVASHASATRITVPVAQTREVLDVRVTADALGVGCTYQQIVRTGTQLVVEDGADNVLGTGTFALTPTADSCDWSTSVTLPNAGFYRLSAGGEDLQTLSHAEMVRSLWSLHFDIDVTGGVTSVAS